MLTLHSGYSKSVNPEKAIFESVTQVAIRENIEVNLGVLHTTLGYNLQKLLDAFHKAHPNAEIVGSTGSGVISNGWVSESKRALASMIVSEIKSNKNPTNEIIRSNMLLLVSFGE